MKENYHLILLLLGLSFRGLSQSVVPTPPYISGSQEVSISVKDSVSISGTLTYAGDEILVIMIAGSGPTDRDCNSAIGLKTDAFKMLAEHLRTNGVSSYRYDKRGIGQSTKVPESTMSFDHFVSDVHTIIDDFKNDFHQIILFGHSEGALIGAMATIDNPNIDQLISASGTSLAMDEIIMEQLAKYPKLVPLAQKHIHEIKSGTELSEVHPILKSLFRPSVVPFLASVFAIEPTEVYSKITKPVLILNGACDLQVGTVHAENLHQASPNAELVIVPNMGHVLKELDDDCSNASQAYNDTTLLLHPDLLRAIDQFIVR